MKIMLKEISRDDLKVGDTVGIAREVRCGWGTSFRHRRIYPATIVKITTKRTKIETDQFGEHDKYERFYEYDNNAKKETELAEKFVKIKNAIYKLDQFRNVPGLRHLRDEDILEMADYAEKIMEILDSYRNE